MGDVGSGKLQVTSRQFNGPMTRWQNGQMPGSSSNLTPDTRHLELSLSSLFSGTSFQTIYNLFVFIKIVSSPETDTLSVFVFNNIRMLSLIFISLFLEH